MMFSREAKQTSLNYGIKKILQIQLLVLIRNLYFNCSELICLCSLQEGWTRNS